MPFVQLGFGQLASMELLLDCFLYCFSNCPIHAPALVEKQIVLDDLMNALQRFEPVSLVGVAVAGGGGVAADAVAVDVADVEAASVTQTQVALLPYN